MRGNHGRVEYVATRKSWRAIWYAGSRDLEIGLFTDRDHAVAALQGVIGDHHDHSWAVRAHHLQWVKEAHA